MDYEYRKSGDRIRISKRISAMGAETEYEYDEAGNLLSVTDPMENKTSVEYDALNRAVKMKYPEEMVRAFEYDPEGNLEKIIYGEGGIAGGEPERKYEYDHMDRLIKFINEEEEETEYEYDGNGNATRITDPMGNFKIYEYDELNRLLRVKTYGKDTPPQLGPISEWSWEYDAEGNATTLTDAGGNQHKYEYDAMDRVTRWERPGLTPVQYEYDPMGNLSRLLVEGVKDVTWLYDGLNRPVREVGAGEVEYTYDEAGRVSRIRNPWSDLLYVYDADNRVTREISAPVKPYDRDSDEGFPWPQYPNRFEFGYDAAGRRLSRSHSDPYELWIPNPPVRPAGGFWDHLASDPEEKYEYDGLGRLKKLWNDPLKYAGEYMYIYEGTDFTAEFEYDKTRGRLIEIKRSGGAGMLTTKYDRDKAGRVTRIINDIQNGTDVVYNYEYDDAGNVTAFNEETYTGYPNPLNAMKHEYEYGYNGGYRLLTASHPEELLGTLADEGYSYDGVGNRLSALADNLGHSGEVNYEYDFGGNTNMLTADALYDYEYDGDGRLTKRTEKATGWYRSLVWDARDRLLSVEEYDSAGTMQSYYRYYYDGLGRRIARQVNGTMYRYVYDGANVVHEMTLGPEKGTREPSQGMGLMPGPDNPYGYWTARYTWAGTDFMLNMLRSEAIGWRLWLRNRNGGPLDECSQLYDPENPLKDCDVEPLHVGNYFPVLDRQNTVRGYYDMELREGFSNNTPMVAMYEYDSFGRPTHEEGLLHSPHRFTGREFDPETGYYFYRARYYDPSLGRFLTQDPVFHNDLYSYVGNNPINFSDPYGMNIWDDIQAVIDFAKDPQGAIQEGIDEVMGQPTVGTAEDTEPPETEKEEEEEEETAPDTPAPPSSTPTGFWSDAANASQATANAASSSTSFKKNPEGEYSPFFLSGLRSEDFLTELSEAEKLSEEDYERVIKKNITVAHIEGYNEISKYMKFEAETIINNPDIYVEALVGVHMVLMGGGLISGGVDVISGSIALSPTTGGGSLVGTIPGTLSVAVGAYVEFKAYQILKRAERKAKYYEKLNNLSGGDKVESISPCPGGAKDCYIIKWK